MAASIAAMSMVAVLPSATSLSPLGPHWVELPASSVTGFFEGISCTTATDCTAVGGDGDGQPFFATEVGGTWGPGRELGGGGVLDAVSCPTGSSCTAVGGVAGALYATETDGVWTPGPAVPQGVDYSWSSLGDVSCTAATTCAASGSQSEDIHTFPLEESESSGTWSDGDFGWPTFGWLQGISCASAGNCIAVGNDGNGEGYAGEPTYVTESGGTWGNGTEVSVGTNGGLFHAISCPSANDCVAVGNDWQGDAFYVADVGGTWGTPQIFTAPSGVEYVPWSVSCADATDCAIAGTEFFNGTNEPIAVLESSGVWGSVAALSVPGGEGTLRGVSCAVATSCTAVGEDANDQPVEIQESNGTWGSGAEVAVSHLVPTSPTSVAVDAGDGTATISWAASASPEADGPITYTATASPGSRSCESSTTTCTISGLSNGSRYAVDVTASNSVGESVATSAVLPFIPGVAVRVTMHVAKPSVTYGNEATEVLSVVVRARSGTMQPGGRVEILSGTDVLCTMGLRAGVSSVRAHTSQPQRGHVSPRRHVPRQLDVRNHDGDRHDHGAGRHQHDAAPTELGRGGGELGDKRDL